MLNAESSNELSENEELINSTKGSMDWVSRLASEHRVALLRYAFSVCRNHERAEDAVQETFVRLLRQTEETLLGKEVPWLYRVCRSRIIDMGRKENRMISMEPTLSRTMPDEGKSPLVKAEGKDLFNRLLAVIDELPAAQREVVRLKFQGQMNYEEIAEVTEKSVNAVGVLLHMGLKNLRKRMSADRELSSEDGGRD